MLSLILLMHLSPFSTQKPKQSYEYERQVTPLLYPALSNDFPFIWSDTALAVIYKTSQDLWIILHSHMPPSSLTPFPLSLTPLQPHWLSYSSSNTPGMVSPLCTWCYFVLAVTLSRGFFPHQLPTNHPPYFLRTSLKGLHLRKALLITLFQTQPSSILYIPILALFFLL